MSINEGNKSTSKHSHYGIYAGMCAAAGSMFGKLLGFTGDLTIYNIGLKSLVVVLMLTCNAAVWTFFVKALQSSRNSFMPTITSAATNYISSAIIGFLLFGEITSPLWWCGTFFILSGLGLILFGEKDGTNIESKSK